MNAALSGRFGLRTPFIARLLSLGALLALLASGALAASANISMDGKGLHDANCRGCHDSSVYTRAGRSVHSLAELKQQLDSCAHASGKALSPAEKQQIVTYLNEQFYKFH